MCKGIKPTADDYDDYNNDDDHHDDDDNDDDDDSFNAQGNDFSRIMTSKCA